MKKLACLIALLAPCYLQAESDIVRQSDVDFTASSIVASYNVMQSRLQFWAEALVKISDLPLADAEKIKGALEDSIGSEVCDPSYVMDALSNLNPDLNQYQFKTARNYVLQMTSLYHSRQDLIMSQCVTYGSMINANEGQLNGLKVKPSISANGICMKQLDIKF